LGCFFAFTATNLAASQCLRNTICHLSLLRTNPFIEQPFEGGRYSVADTFHLSSATFPVYKLVNLLSKEIL